MSLLRELLESARNFIATIGAVTIFFGRTMTQLPRALIYHAAGRNEWARELLFPQ